MSGELALVEAVVALRGPLLTSFFLAITAFGSVTGLAIVVLGLAAAGRGDIAILSTVAAAVAGLAELAINQVVGRARPPVEMLEQPWSSSFPSGHATLAFAVATVIGATVPEARPYVYLVAALVAISRVYLGMHYPTDVIAGAVLGIAAGLLVIRYRDPLLAAVPG